MKFWSKEALLLGGIYTALEIPFSLAGFDILTDLFFVLFVVSLVMLFMNKVPKILSYILNTYPTSSYYLCSFGWIPYVLLSVFVVFICSGFFIDYSQAFTSTFIYTLSSASWIGVVVSVCLAYMRKKRKQTQN